MSRRCAMFDRRGPDRVARMMRRFHNGCCAIRASRSFSMMLKQGLVVDAILVDLADLIPANPPEADAGRIIDDAVVVDQAIAGPGQQPDQDRGAGSRMQHRDGRRSGPRYRYQFGNRSTHTARATMASAARHWPRRASRWSSGTSNRSMGACAGDRSSRRFSADHLFQEAVACRGISFESQGSLTIR